MADERLKDKRRRWWIAIAVALGLFCVFYVCFFSLISIHDHIWYAEKPGLVGAAARLHLRYLRVFDPEEKNRVGDALLHVALYNVFDAFPHPEEDEARMALAKVLLARGANINSTDKEGMTLLMSALRDYNDNKALALLSLGADPRGRGQGQYGNDDAMSLFDEQVERDSAAFPRILKCDQDLLKAEQFWKMVNVRFAMHVAGIDRRNCRPKTDEEIATLVAKHGDQIRRLRLAKAMRDVVQAATR